jgi:hypothetical protein
MSELYRIFAEDWSHKLDFSDEALLSLYNHESYGTSLSPNNGFAVGKQYLNLQVTMWREDLAAGLIFKWELYDDPKYPHWWLDSVLSNKTPAAEILKAKPCLRPSLSQPSLSSAPQSSQEPSQEMSTSPTPES